MDLLLAVDLGVKTGFALYGSDSRLLWFRSQNFGNVARLRKAIPGLLSHDDELRFLVIEGGGPLLKIWTREAIRKNIDIINIMAQTWRRDIMLQREQKRSKATKINAVAYARRVIDSLAVNRATSLNDDAAEAILIGLWGMMKVGWVRDIDDILKNSKNRNLG